LKYDLIGLQNIEVEDITSITNLIQVENGKRTRNLPTDFPKKKKKKKIYIYEVKLGITYRTD